MTTEALSGKVQVYPVRRRTASRSAGRAGRTGNGSSAVWQVCQFLIPGSREIRLSSIGSSIGEPDATSLSDRAVTALAKRLASPAPSLPPRILNPARAQKSAHWLRAFGNRLISCTAAAAPLRRQANNRSPACGLHAATVSGAPPRRHAARHGFGGYAGEKTCPVRCAQLHTAGPG